MTAIALTVKMFTLIILFIRATTDACSCMPLSEKAQFCESDWVSHVVVTHRVIDWYGRFLKPPKPLLNALYVVEHIDVFKRPWYLPRLPGIITTPSDDGMCGLTLEEGGEYLISGRSTNQISYPLRATLCSQILTENSTTVPMLWEQVPEGFEDFLSDIKCHRKTE